MFGDDARRPKKPLEKIPFIFRYVFTCDEPACHSHTMMCADWEMASLYRNCRRGYGDKWEPKFRQKYEATMIQKLDTQFFVGTVHRWSTWIIIGVFYPARESKTSMHELLEQAAPGLSVKSSAGTGASERSRRTSGRPSRSWRPWASKASPRTGPSAISGDTTTRISQGRAMSYKTGGSIPALAT